jgi:AraC family transcriptional regulator, regulatory protein of adaptative response / methylated-DNA-[protein]-cysteine methyltransferase
MENEPILCAELSTPLGGMIVGSTAEGCCLVEFQDRGGVDKIRAAIKKRYRRNVEYGDSAMNLLICRQLTEYFEGNRVEFDMPLDIVGTPFEKSVWKELLATPLGKTRSYGEIAVAVRRPQAQRAVGRANGANRIAIVIPCHRIIEANGKLRGYGGGLWRKKWLLEHEQKVATGAPVSLFG